MSVNAAEVVKRVGTVTTSSLGSQVILPDQQAEEFLKKIRDVAPTLRLVRHENMTAPTKKVNKIGISRRVLRQGSENVAPTTQQPFEFDQMTLTAQLMKAAYELTRQAKRDTHSRAKFEEDTINVMSEAIGIDSNDLLWNGDTTDYSSASSTINEGGPFSDSDTTLTVASTTGFPPTSYGYGFLVIENERISYLAKTATDFTGLVRGDDGTTAASHADTTAVTFVADALYPVYDGVLKQITDGGTTVDGTTINSGDLSYDHFEALLDGQPAKYRNNPRIKDSNRWCCNDKMRRRWRRTLTQRATALGDMSIYGEDKDGPHGVKFHIDEALPDGVLVLAPLNGIVHGARTDNMMVARTSEGKDLVSRSATYYQWEIEGDVTLDESDMFGRVNDITMTLT